MKRYTLSELQSMPTIEQGHTDDLKVSSNMLIAGVTRSTKVWLSRLTIEDGAVWDHEVTVEVLSFGSWITFDCYPALDNCDNCGAVEGTEKFDNFHDSQNCWVGDTYPAV